MVFKQVMVRHGVERYQKPFLKSSYNKILTAGTHARKRLSYLIAGKIPEDSNALFQLLGRRAFRREVIQSTS